MGRIRTYSELITIPDFQNRFLYLKLNSKVGFDTFGWDRVFNQMFYLSKEWRDIRNYVIARDNGCDMACQDYPIFGEKIFIHHMNPISMEDLEKSNPMLLDPEFLITMSFPTHNAIHYGNVEYLQQKQLIIRTPNDTCPWKNKR